MKTLAFLPFMFGISSCFSQKQIAQDSGAMQTDSITSQINISAIKKNDEIVGTKIPSKSGILKIQGLNWEHFNGRYNIDIDLGNGQTYNGSMNFRMKRDSIFWFSITASIGFQIAKGLIINDTLHGLDLLQKNYYRVALKDLQTSTQLPAQIGALQRLFTGEILSELIYFDFKDSSFHGDETFYPGYLVRLDDSNKVIQNSLNDNIHQRYLWADYIERLATEQSQLSVATQSSIYLKDALNTIRLDVRLKTYGFEPIPSYPFKVPNGYTLMESW